MPTKIYGQDQIRDRTIKATQIGLLEITNAEISASAAIALTKLEEAVIQADGGQAFTGTQSMGSNFLTNLLNPVNPQDAATKDYVDTAVLGAVNYIGTINMSVDPGLAAPSTGNDGDLYIVSVASAGAASYANLPASTVYNVGDWIISHGAGTWDYVGAEDASSSNVPFTTALRDASGDFAMRDVTTRRLGAGAAPAWPLDVTQAVTAAGAVAYGARFLQTITAAANGDNLIGVLINPTFDPGIFSPNSMKSLSVFSSGQERLYVDTYGQIVVPDGSVLQVGSPGAIDYPSLIVQSAYANNGSVQAFNYDTTSASSAAVKGTATSGAAGFGIGVQGSGKYAGVQGAAGSTQAIGVEGVGAFAGSYGVRGRASGTGSAGGYFSSTSGTAHALLAVSAFPEKGLRVTFDGSIEAVANVSLRLYNAADTFYVGHRSTAARAANVVYEWPGTDPTAGQFLTAALPVAGVSALTWASLSGTALDAVFSSNGLLTRTAAGTYTSRTITGTTDRIGVSNGDGVSGNPTIDISANYVGQTSLTTLGTVATGTWNATTIATTKGGTGLTSYVLGDTLYASAANTLTALAGNITATRKFFAQTGTGAVSAAPVWVQPASADISDAASNPTASVLSIRDGGGGAGFSTIWGSIASGGTLTLQSTAHATKGKILFGTSAYDEVNNRLGIANASPAFPLDVTGAANITAALTIGGLTTSTIGTFSSSVADGAAAKAFAFKSVALSTTGAKIFSFANDATETNYIDKDGHFALLEQAQVRLFDVGSSHYIGLRSNSARTTNLVYDLPITDPTVGQILTAAAPSGGVSALSWSSASALSGVDVNPTPNTIPLRTATGGANFGERVLIKASTAVPASNLLHLTDSLNNDLFRFDYLGGLTISPPGTTGGGLNIIIPSGSNATGLLIQTQQSATPGYAIFVDASSAGSDTVGVYSNAKSKAFEGVSSLASGRVFHGAATHSQAIAGYFTGSGSTGADATPVYIQKQVTSGAMANHALNVEINKSGGSWSGDFLLLSEFGSGATLSGYVIRHYDGSANKFLLDRSGNLLTAGYARVGSVTAPTNVTAGDFTSLRALVGADSAFGAGMTLDVNGLARVRSQLGIGALANASYDLNMVAGTFLSGVVNGASAIGFTFNTPAYTTTAKLIELRNDGNAKVSFRQDGVWTLGGIDLLDTSGYRVAKALSGASVAAGDRNVFLGGYIANFITTGDYNTCIGREAGNALTSGLYNSFFGYQSGAQAQDSQYCLAIGYRTLYSMTTGTVANNVGIGREAGFSNVGGYDNMYIGTNAGYNNVSGFRNVYVGVNAGIANLGSGNIAFGFNTGPSSAQTYNYSIAMGYEAFVTASNQMVVGGSSGNGINDIYLGSGVVYTSPLGVTINATGGSGTDVAGADLIIAGGKPTGAGAGGSILFKTGDTGATGTTLRSLTTKASINGVGTFKTLFGRVVAVRVVTAAGAVTAAVSDHIIEVNKSSGAATTVNLFASPATGTTLIIKDGKGDAATNNITITPAAGNIDGAATYVIATNYGSVTIYYSGTEWRVI